MYVTELKISNLRSFSNVEIELNTPTVPRKLAFPNINVFLGSNGAGKTTVMRAVALATLGPLLVGGSGFVPDGLIRRSGRGTARLAPASATATVALDEEELPGYAKTLFNKGSSFEMTTHIQSVRGVERLSLDRLGDRRAEIFEELQFDERSTAFFVAGYGSTRWVESSARVDESARRKSRLRRYERVSSLFEEHVGLMPLSYWLPELQSATGVCTFRQSNS